MTKKSPLPCLAGGIVHANFTPSILMSNGIEDFWSALEIGAQEVIEADKEWIESDIEIRLIRDQLRTEYRQLFKRK